MSAAVMLRMQTSGKVQFQGRVDDLSPDQLVKLRAYRDELAPIIAAYGEVEVVIRPATPLPEPEPPRWPELSEKERSKDRAYERNGVLT